MELDDTHWVSGYGSRLEMLAGLAAERFRQARGTESSVRSELRWFLREGFRRGLRLDHLSQVLQHVLRSTGYGEVEIKTILEVVSELISPTARRLVVVWSGTKPSTAEIFLLRRLLPSLEEMTVRDCKALLARSKTFEFGRFENLLEAEVAREQAESHGVHTTLETIST